MPEKTSEPNPARARSIRRWVLLLLVILAVPLIGISLVGRKTHIEPGSVLVVHLEGDLPEAPSQGILSTLQRLAGAGEGTSSLHELRRGLRHAKDDPRIAGVILEISSVDAPWAMVEEIRDLLGELRAANKPVQAILTGDGTGEKEYSLAAATDRVVAVPETMLMLSGVAVEAMFFRGLFDKLGVQPQFVQFKEYKSAAEPFINKSMSGPMRESLAAILGEIQDRFVAQVAQRRKLEPAQVRQAVDRGLLTASEAVTLKLLDGLGYRDELEDALLPKGTPGTTDAGQASGKSPNKHSRLHYLPSLGRYLSSLPDEPSVADVALIYAVGMISAGTRGDGTTQGEVIQGERTARYVRQAAEDDRIKAIVLRVNSPGGSAVGSDFVRREVEKARKKKPVVVSMSGVAASGGYWISMDASAIVAEPATLTGSIGVVFGHFDVMPPLRWAGINVDTLKFGENADLLSPFHDLNPAQLAVVTRTVGQTYEDFVNRVAKGRGLTYQQAEPLAHGRVWSGSDAKERKLIDELGGLLVALRIARDKAGLPPDDKAEPVVFPAQEGLLVQLLRGQGVALGSGWAALLGRSGLMPRGGSEGRMVEVAEAAEEARQVETLRDLLRELGTPRLYLLAPPIEIR